MSRIERPLLRQWLVGGVAVALAWVASATTPGIDVVQAPFPVAVALGERGVGRNFDITVTAVQAAESVSAKGFGDRIWTADGNWLVVDLVASARVEAASLGLATLTVDGRTWAASERPTSMRQEWLQPGLGRSGSLAFELPASLRSGAGQLRLGMGSLGAELDSQLVLPIDLGELPIEPRVDLQPTEWAVR